MRKRKRKRKRAGDVGASHIKKKKVTMKWWRSAGHFRLPPYPSPLPQTPYTYHQSLGRTQTLAADGNLPPQQRNDTAVSFTCSPRPRTQDFPFISWRSFPLSRRRLRGSANGLRWNRPTHPSLLLSATSPFSPPIISPDGPESHTFISFSARRQRFLTYAAFSSFATGTRNHSGQTH